MKGRFVPLVVFAALAVLLAAGLKLKPREVPSPFIGKPAPAFALASLRDGSKTLTPADFAGQPWLLNVWASWCAPCREEHALISAIAREQGVVIVGMNYKDDPRSAQEWLIRLGDPYAATASDRDGGAGLDWGVYGVPETFVIDRQGIVRFKHVGPLTAEVWQSRVLPLVRRLEG